MRSVTRIVVLFVAAGAAIGLAAVPASALAGSRLPPVIARRNWPRAILFA